MSRPREFDENEVLDRALDAFWSKGFDGTSVGDLVEATGIGRASLYGAFGDKEGLYKRVVERYASRVGSMCPGEAPPLVALERLLSAWVGMTCPKAGPRGCFLLLAGTGGGDASFAREALVASHAKMEAELAALVAKAQARGEVDASRDPVAAARLLVVIAQGIASSARAGWDEARLRGVVREAIAAISR